MLILIKVALAFAGVLFLLRRRVRMALAMLAAAVALAVLFWLPSATAVALAVSSLTSRATVELTGSSQSSIVMALPMLAGLPGGATSALFALVFVWGLSGLMLAPAHPCFVVTLQHFRASFGTVQRLVLLPQAVLVAIATTVYLALPG